MKVIYPDRIQSISASSSASGFPVENLLDDWPQNIWKATSNTASITIEVGGSSDAIAMFNVNADTVTINVEDEDQIEIDLRVIDTYESLILDTPNIYREFFIEYPYKAVQHTITIELEAPEGDIVSAGIIRAGLSRTFSNPDYPLQETWQDYSIIKRTVTGRTYVVHKPKARKLSGSFLAPFESDFLKFITLYRELDFKPFAWLVASDVDDKHFAVFARFENPPSIRHAYPGYVVINFILEEVV